MSNQDIKDEILEMSDAEMLRIEGIFHDAMGKGRPEFVDIEEVKESKHEVSNEKASAFTDAYFKELEK